MKLVALCSSAMLPVSEAVVGFKVTAAFRRASYFIGYRYTVCSSK